MTFGAPAFLFAGLVAAVAVAALHLLAWRRPPAAPLPTARFIPERSVRAVAFTVRPTDLVLLAVRVLMVLLLALALARPSLAARRAGSARVVVADLSRAVTDTAALRDRVRAAFRAERGDALVVFDSTAREVGGGAADSLGALVPGGARGSLSAALVTAIRAAERLRRVRDTVEIVVVSPLVEEEVDAATASIRALWDGHVRVARLSAPAPRDADPRPIEVTRATGDDPVAAAARLAPPPLGGHEVRIVRDSMTSADSAWLAGGRGRVLIEWPVMGARAPWAPVEREDTAFAVALTDDRRGSVAAPASGATVVARFVRRAFPPPGHVSARWSDGKPAAAETSLGGGCVRHVAIAVPGAGDLALTPAFRRLVRGLAAPCGGMRGSTPVRDSVAAMITGRPQADSVPMGAKGAAAVSRRSASADDAAMTGGRFPAWLLAGALALALAELAMRGARRPAAGEPPGGTA